MGMTQDVQRSLRLHIGFFGKRNSGKSSLVNALCGQNVAIVSDVPGTTADAVYKNIEIGQLGACVLVDTAGFDDEGTLGALRNEATRKAAAKVDAAVIVMSVDDESGYEDERWWIHFFSGLRVPVIAVMNKTDLCGVDEVESKLKHIYGMENVQDKIDVVLTVSAYEGTGIENLRTAIAKTLTDKSEVSDITGKLCRAGDVVLLVMPQDIQAPKGRLILPQVQTLRHLLDKRCLPVCCTADNMPDLLAALAAPPRLIITDSQVFKTVERYCPEVTLLTSFSVLFAGCKGDIQEFAAGARAIDNLLPESHVLIAEACTHIPQHEDIGRVKLPRLLRKRIGEGLRITHVNGADFPDDLSPFDLIIHCGACMFTRRHVLNRIALAKASQVPITNYGMAIAFLNDMLDRVALGV
ncbi:MAG: [FeFe] hydrogenase H-cluster maturation GTPase HydF [Bacteroides sp.]|nr:[FeFe] hydrogenase H-cluster maturation GTPase HydF [Roseburia sp.]MCM1346739.1 [FeFe] hydrogenase H-cluster maturation GTPase HydF [Bacteroides sp.]MCM1420179.1 [FeFe] hydrogenase H-cluster maturation GTPase HydF [Bacteroides sp.]